MTSKITWWNSTARADIYLRWSVLVTINAAFPFVLSILMLTTPAHYVGVGLALITFIILYAEVDSLICERGHIALSRQLRISAAVKIGTPLLPFIDMLIGMLSISVVQWITGYGLDKALNELRHTNTSLAETTITSQPFTEASAAYLTTMIDGFVLSILVALILGLLRAFSRLSSHRKTRNDSALAETPYLRQ